MKKSNNLYNEITKLNNIIDIYDKVVKKNTKNKYKLEKFDDYYSININNIRNILKEKKYIPDKYNIFIIREPKLRIIMSQSIKDKIINHLVAKYILLKVFDKKLIDTNCATRINKGTHYALNKFKKYLNDCKRNYKDFYILKFDINKYFYNIDHNIVKEIIKDNIKDKDSINILNKIIDSTNELYINDSINRLKEKEIKKLDINDRNYNKKYDELNKIPLYEKDKGLPIGNMTSQVVATFYLNELDHFIKEELKIKYYIRYMDDGIIIHNNKLYLKECIRYINIILNKYKLTLNKKTKIYKAAEPIEFLGFIFFIKNNKIILKLKKETKQRFKRRILKINYRLINDNILFKYFISIYNSYKNHLSYGNCKYLLFKYK